MTTTSPALQIIELIDRHDWPAAVELVAPTVRVRIGGQELDRDSWLGFGQMFYAAFPDAKHTIHRVIDAGDQVTVLASFTGTHQGAFMGIAPTGRRITMDVIHVDKVANGRIVEHQGQFDSAGLMQQLTGPTVDPKAYADKLFTTIDSQQFDQTLELLAPGFTFSMGGQTLDRAGYVEFGKMFFAAFRDGKHTNREVFASGDRIVVIGEFSGTHDGAFQGLPATGRTMSFGYIGVATLGLDGKLRRMEVQGDLAGMMRQLTA
jgi:predicted ester cyclase